MNGKSQAHPGLGPSFISLSEQIELNGRFKGADPAFIESGHVSTWAEVNEVANRVANLLIELGVQPGDHVATMFDCEIASFEITFGIWRTGAAFVPLSPMLKPHTLQSLLVDAGVRILLTSDIHAKLCEAAIDGTSVKRISFGEGLAAMIEGQADDPPRIPIEPDSLANIIYSSGTTGTPKGIPHTHRARIGLVSSISTVMGFTPQSVGLLAIPPHSNASFVMWASTAYFGAPTVLMRYFNAEAFFGILKRHRPTHAILVPTMCAAILAHPDHENAGLDCFECALTAGAPMPRAMKQVMRRLTREGLAELWGLTESIATIISPSEMADRPDSVGRPCPGIDIRLVDDDGQDVTFSGEGEIVGRSSHLMIGYWHRPETNEELIWTSPEGKSYLRTGDIGIFDSEGYLTLRGRAKDMLISGGLNVFPTDLEAQLLEHEAVADATVVGIADPKWGEVPIAFVIPEDGVNVDTEDLKLWLNERLAKHQRVREIVIRVEDFPRNSLGKVLKNELRTQLEKSA